jgi:hypothetical protein
MFAQAGQALAGMLCFMGVALVIGTLIGAIILRAACSLFNKFAGGESASGAVPEPSMGSAMAITFVTTLVNMAVGFVLGLALQGAGPNQAASQAIINLISIPISLLVFAGMVTVMLPTTFGKGLLIALLYLLIAFVIGCGIAIIVVGVMLAMGMKLGR